MTRGGTVIGWAIAAIALACLPACGGAAGSATAPSGPAPAAGGGLTVTITSAGVSPKTITVSQGAQVTFVNNDASPHWIYSDPHPDHTDCPEINQVGALYPGQSRQTGNLNTVRTCGYHDHEQPLNSSLQGSIVIQP